MVPLPVVPLNSEVRRNYCGDTQAQEKEEKERKKEEKERKKEEKEEKERKRKEEKRRRRGEEERDEDGFCVFRR